MADPDHGHHVAAGVIIERYRSLNMLAGDSNTTADGCPERCWKPIEYRDAFELCNQQQGPVPAILATGLRKASCLANIWITSPLKSKSKS